MATGRVSVAEVQAADTVSAGSRSSNASSPVRWFFQFPTNFGSGGALSKITAWAKRLSRPVVGWVFSVQTGIVWLATQIFDNLVGRRSNVRQNFE